MQLTWVWTLLMGREGSLFALCYNNYAVALVFAWKTHLVFDNRIIMLWIL